MSSSEIRPNPDELLKAIQQEEKASKRGHLKIFLGMAAGVGKTYAMLEEAQAIKRQDTNILVGIVNTHGRSDTAALLAGLTVIPLKKISYKDIEFEEFDLDEVLRLKPKLVLVDELAHTNVPGSRHNKRWQDVNELLENGIDVYTTLNVQHIESLKDVIENITNIKIRETVPDSIVESASSIELVDLSPNELLQRLKEGKVYLGDKSEIAAQNFFKEDRLTALREIVLRYAAEKVDHDLRELVSSLKRTSSWKPRERLLAAISHNEHSQKLIRTARRLASHNNAPWIALHVNDGTVLTEQENNMLAKNLALARELGAEVITTNDPNIVDAIQRVAKQHGVTQIVIGRSPTPAILGIFPRISLLDKLTKECTDIDILVVKKEALITRYRNKLISFSYVKDLNHYIIIFFATILLTFFNWMLLPIIGYKIIGVIYLLAILALSLFFKKGPIFFASVLFALTWDILFIPPEGNLTVLSTEDKALLLLFLITAITTGILVDRARTQKEMLAKREETTRALYNIVRQIAGGLSSEQTIKSVKERLEKLFDGTFEIIIKKIDGTFDLENAPPLIVDIKEKATAQWVFENEKEAGWSTETLPLSKNLYIPIKGFHEIFGLLVYKPKTNKTLSPEEKNFIYTICQQLGSYFDRVFVEEKAKLEQQHKQIEKVHRTILKWISLIFQEPLIVMQNTIKKLRLSETNPEAKPDPMEIREFEYSLEELIKVLGNISAISQISEGLVPLQKERHSIQEIIHGCSASIMKSSVGHIVKVSIQDNLPPLPLDVYLIQMLLLNLINNAISYSSLGSTIEIDARQIENYVVLSVEDEGGSIPESELDSIFEEFHRSPDAISPGVGLGLTIARTIAELHHGLLKAENRPTKGVKFSLYLPISN